MLGQQFVAFLALLFIFGSNIKFWHQLGINFALMNDFIISGIVKNLVLLSVK